MNETGLIDTVQQRVHVDSREAAYTVTQATLGVLGQCMTREDAENLASQLPESLEGTVTDEREIDRALSREEFIERVHRRENEEGEFSGSATERHVPAYCRWWVVL